MDKGGRDQNPARLASQSALSRRLPSEIGQRRGQKTDFECIRRARVARQSARVHALRDRGEAKEREREVKRIMLDPSTLRGAFVKREIFGLAWDSQACQIAAGQPAVVG